MVFSGYGKPDAENYAGGSARFAASSAARHRRRRRDDVARLAGIHPGYWQRAGLLRAHVIALGRRARLGHALIAQSCLDHDLPLLTRDRNFLAFAAAGGLKLALP